MNNFDLAIHFFLQLVVILLACRGVGYLARFLGQPQVVGEMIAGVLLGPSLLAAFLPLNTYQWLFPKTLVLEGHAPLPHPSMTVLYCLAQVGLVLYMFVVGLEFNTSLFKKNCSKALSVSLAGIAAPFALGGLVAWYYSTDLRFWQQGLSVFECVLYLGAAMSITAFPMLARIIHERGLSGTRLGLLALSAGAIDDALAWCMLALVLASAKGSGMIAVSAMAGGLIFFLVMTMLVRPLLQWMAARPDKLLAFNENPLPLVAVLLMCSAWFTDYVGIYAVFGAFIFGAVFPKGLINQKVRRAIEPLTVNLFLPLFFVYSGLNTKLTLVDSWELAGVTLLIIGVACLGKGVACWLSARWNGFSPAEASGVGILMNARGLMELIILNIGFEQGIITQTLFSIMVLMAIVTTLLATPLFNLVSSKYFDEAAAELSPEDEGSAAVA